MALIPRPLALQAERTRAGRAPHLGRRGIGGVEHHQLAAAPVGAPRAGRPDGALAERDAPGVEDVDVEQLLARLRVHRAVAAPGVRAGHGHRAVRDAALDVVSGRRTRCRTRARSRRGTGRTPAFSP